MKPITAYQTIDNAVFLTEQEARDHELHCCGKYKMWDSHGVRTTDVDTAYYVALYTDFDAALFIEACRKSNSECGNIEEGDTGLFVWDECGNYQWLATVGGIINLKKVMDEAIDV